MRNLAAWEDGINRVKARNSSLYPGNKKDSVGRADHLLKEIHEAALAVRVGDELGREDFKGDFAVEFQVEGLVDNPSSR